MCTTENVVHNMGNHHLLGSMYVHMDVSKYSNYKKNNPTVFAYYKLRQTNIGLWSL